MFLFLAGYFLIGSLWALSFFRRDPLLCTCAVFLWPLHAALLAIAAAIVPLSLKR